jgi:hypothetical protein
MEVIIFSEISVHIRTTRRYIPEDGNIHNHRCENLKSYNMRFITIFSKIDSTKFNAIQYIIVDLLTSELYTCQKKNSESK